MDGSIMSCGKGHNGNRPLLSEKISRSDNDFAIETNCDIIDKMLIDRGNP
jgi:hypothetical protein